MRIVSTLAAPARPAKPSADREAAASARWTAHSAAVEARLAELLADQDWFDDVYRAVLSSPGKRLRAGLVMTCAALLLPAEAEPSAAALDTACAVEMLHEASLIHDDICDGSLIRRGQASVPAAFGVRRAACAGMHLAGVALDVIADIADRGPQPPVPGAGLGSVRLSEFAFGQILEGLAPVDANVATLRRHYRAVAAAKTGTLFRIACAAGGTLAHCGEVRMRALDEYATQLAFAYQVMDDVRDAGDGDRPERGIGTDVARGVPSWPVIEWFALRDDATRRWREPDDDPAGTGRLIAICADVVHSGATASARRVAEQASRHARAALRAFPPTPARRHLANLCTRVVAG